MNDTKAKRPIRRREALKVLAAAGVGLASSTLLPGKWDKPAMQVGVLPAHAQASQITFYTIADSSENAYWTQQEDYLLDLIVYISPADSGVAMKATLWLELPNAAVTDAYGSPISVPPVNTVSGKATFAPILLPFYWLRMKVTYEFVNAGQCNTGCTWTVEYTNVS